MKRRIFYIVMGLILSTLFACEGLLKTGAGTEGLDNNNPSTTASMPVNVGDEVEFSGGVDIFDLEVEGKTFESSETFFTRLVADIILSNPKYESLKDATLKVGGEQVYGLGEWGKNKDVFISSESEDGHLFETKTGGDRNFKISVKASATDESFTCRAIQRISLEITHDGDTEATKVCIILTGIRKNIAITDHRKPIIFRKWSFSISDYRCDQVSSSFDLPDTVVNGGTNAADTSDNGDGSTTLSPTVTDKSTDDDTEVSVVPAHIEISNTIKVPMEEFEISSLSYSPVNNQLVIGKVTTNPAFENTKFVLGAMTLKWSEEVGQKFKIAPTIDAFDIHIGHSEIDSLVESPTGLLSMYGAASYSNATNTHLAILDANYIMENTVDGAPFGVIFYLNDKLMGISLESSPDYHDQSHLCEVDFNIEDLAANCIQPSYVINRESSPLAVNESVFNSALSPHRSRLKVTGYKNKVYVYGSVKSIFNIYKFSDQLAYEGKYNISKLIMSADDLAASYIVGDVDDFYLVTSKGGNLVFRIVDFVE